jgi:Holliday junction resolvase RusA-like endonuclease
VLEIQLPLNPVPASRPRVARAGFSYYEQPYKGFKDEIKDLLRERYGGPLIDYPVFVTIVVFAEAPKKSKLPFPKPDFDNYAKGVCDGMTGIVLQDDWLIQKGSCEKFWAATGEPGRIHIYIDRA